MKVKDLVRILEGIDGEAVVEFDDVTHLRRCPVNHVYPKVEPKAVCPVKLILTNAFPK